MTKGNDGLEKLSRLRRNKVPILLFVVFPAAITAAIVKKHFGDTAGITVGVIAGVLLSLGLWLLVKTGKLHGLIEGSPRRRE